MAPKWPHQKASAQGHVLAAIEALCGRLGRLEESMAVGDPVPKVVPVGHLVV